MGNQVTVTQSPESVPRIGIDLGGTKIEGVRIEPGDSIAQRMRVATPKDSYDSTLEAIAGVVDQLCSGTSEIPTVGICTPGAISPATGRIKNANSTRLNGHPLAEDLERRLGRRVRLANDANCFALSEAIDGAARGARVVFGAILGTGVGGGIVVDRHPLVGPNAIAGEWGHNALPWPADGEWPGPPCYCGRAGCIETFLSGPGLSRDHERSTGDQISSEAVVALAKKGDDGAQATLERFEERLARALAMVINILDPDVIVLGGGLSNIERLYANVPRLWGRHVFSDRVDTRLMPPVHGDSGGVRGAAWLWT
jgi:fructokinase